MLIVHAGMHQEVDNAAVVQLLESLRHILVIAGPPKVAHEVIDRQLLAFVRRCLLSPFFNKRLHGLTDLVRIIHTVQRAAPGETFAWMSQHALATWLREHSIIAALLGARVGSLKHGAHAELTSRAASVLKFSAMHNMVDEATLLLLWDQVRSLSRAPSVVKLWRIHQTVTLFSAGFKW